MLFVINSKAEENNIKYYSQDSGILYLMYHRFDENKYPSTNIQMDIFKEQMSIINTLNYKFYDTQNFMVNLLSFSLLIKTGITFKSNLIESCAGKEVVCASLSKKLYLSLSPTL